MHICKGAQSVRKRRAEVGIERQAEPKLHSPHSTECTHIFFLAICGRPWLKVDGQEKSPGAAAVHQRGYRTHSPTTRPHALFRERPAGKSDPGNNRASQRETRSRQI